MIDWRPFQKRMGLVQDGVAGPLTYRAFFKCAGPSADPHVLGELTDCAIEHFEAYGITTKARLCEFVAQCSNETGGWRAWSENLNYSVKAIRAAWPGRFPTDADALPYARNPQALANKSYGGRMGNDQPGDGWKYRGRGALQLTGKANYQLFGKLLGLDLLNKPETAADPEVSLLIALKFWQRGRVNDAVDRGDFREARKITNGGSIGLEHVADLRAKLIGVLA